MNVKHHLATYGSLAPGCKNHHQVQHLGGEWLKGSVNGTLVEAGWGAALGHPGIVLDESNNKVAVDILVSLNLVDYWQTLDEFEGTGYSRVETIAETDQGPMPVFIYQVKT